MFAMTLLDFGFLTSKFWFLVIVVFQIWMLVDAVRRKEWIWVIFIFLFSGLTALLYFFLVYRTALPSMNGFELPGTQNRKRIKELQDLIHNLDKAHHYLELGDIYFHKGDLKKAEECYRASIAREPLDKDARAHLGQCLLRQGQAQEARPLLQQVCQEDPSHDYGYSQMAYAEALMTLGETSAAIEAWKTVLENHTYARARVQLAELYLATNQKDLALAQLREAISDDAHAPDYQRRRDRVWIRRAKRLL